MTNTLASRFTLVAGKWYAAEFLGDEFFDSSDRRSYSPIRIESVSPMKSGNRQYELSFYHANYPEGVRDKRYSLQTLDRGEHYVLVRSLEHEPARIVFIYDIDWNWLRSHFATSPPERNC